MPQPHQPSRTTPRKKKAEAHTAASDDAATPGDSSARSPASACAVCHKKHSGRMRRADSPHPDFHLLEELAKPRACVTGRRITIWVYRDDAGIREIVLSGHSESRTCASATSIIIEAASQLDPSVQWMLTCGAAYFRVSPEAQAQADGLRQFDSIFSALGGQSGTPAEMLRAFAASMGNRTQVILGEMIRALEELAEDTGLVEVIEQQWEQLERFRKTYAERAGSAAGKLVLPDAKSLGQVADFLPIVPRDNREGKPLVFEFEGWDFDCPEYQLVADIHLRKLQRELLRDARRRRLIYRGWLKEWMDEWTYKLHALPDYQADEVLLLVPPLQEQRATDSTPVRVLDFLKSAAATFLDKGQDWHLEQAARYRQIPFGQLTDSVLDELIHPDQITEVDFERGLKTTRRATEEDKAFSLRERLMFNDPQLISQCLLWIRRMDWIIKPYEEWAQRGLNRRAPQDEDPKERKIRLTDAISRQIVVETMVRGWPSFYLDNKEDREVFDNWAGKYRRHVWARMEQQCKKAGVALDLLLEDNILYEVRFNDNLGCTVQPLMLIDEATHVQLHSRRAGASAAVPVWAYAKSNPAPAPVLQRGKTNRERASHLVQEACRVTTGPQGHAGRAAELLQTALACHPAEAGKLILQEWARRIGRDTGAEFYRARSMVNAGELAFATRYEEAKAKLDEYLTAEPHPVPDAYVILALSGLLKPDSRLVEFKECVERYSTTASTYNALAESLKDVLDVLRRSGHLSHDVLERLKLQDRKPEDLTRLRVLSDELERLDRKINTLKTGIEAETEGRRQWIEKALRQPAAVLVAHPHLAIAVEKAREELAAVLENNCLYKQSEKMFRRYSDTAKIIEVRGLLDLLYELLLLQHKIGKDPNKARREAIEEMQRLTQALWIAPAVKSDLKMLAEEFGKGEWDRLQAGTIRAIINGAASSCHARIHDLLSERLVVGLSMKESLLTRIHLLQVLDGKYKQAFDSLLAASVPFGIAISTAWNVLDDQTRTIPEGGSLSFDADQRTVFLITQTDRLPLLACPDMSQSDAAYVTTLIGDPDLVMRISQHAACVAEGLLAVAVEPQPEWRLWRDAMKAIDKELLVVLSEFSYEACLMPEHSPPLAEADDDFEKRLNRQTPRQAPLQDWAWREPGKWGRFMDAEIERLNAEHIAT